MWFYRRVDRSEPRPTHESQQCSKIQYSALQDYSNYHYCAWLQWAAKQENREQELTDLWGIKYETWADKIEATLGVMSFAERFPGIAEQMPPGWRGLRQSIEESLKTASEAHPTGSAAQRKSRNRVVLAPLPAGFATWRAVMRETEPYEWGMCPCTLGDIPIVIDPEQSACDIVCMFCAQGKHLLQCTCVLARFVQAARAKRETEDFLKSRALEASQAMTGVVNSLEALSKPPESADKSGHRPTEPRTTVEWVPRLQCHVGCTLLLRH